MWDQFFSPQQDFVRPGEIELSHTRKKQHHAKTQEGERFAIDVFEVFCEPAASSEPSESSTKACCDPDRGGPQWCALSWRTEAALRGAMLRS
jgi:hypothetical protein